MAAYPLRVTFLRLDAPEWHPTIDSTNLEALRDPRPGRVVVADHQSAGLGRRGRSWTAPPGSSVAVTVVAPAPEPHLLGWVPLVTGLAVARAIGRSRYAVPARVKWPNDVLVTDRGEWRKVCGVLAQAVPDGAHGPVVVVGAGINLDQTRDQLPVPTATSWRLARGGAGTPAILPDGVRERLVSDLLEELAALLGDPGAGREDYRAACATIGALVRVHLPGGGERTGTAVAVDDTGALVVDDGRSRTVHRAGDVVHVRPAG